MGYTEKEGGKEKDTPKSVAHRKLGLKKTKQLKALEFTQPIQVLQESQFPNVAKTSFSILGISACVCKQWERHHIFNWSVKNAAH